jgi:hypothetical protein
MGKARYNYTTGHTRKTHVAAPEEESKAHPAADGG